MMNDEFNVLLKNFHKSINKVRIVPISSIFFVDLYPLSIKAQKSLKTRIFKDF
jgi:hypothetical protein